MNTYHSVNQAYRQICNRVMAEGLKVAPRGEETRELLSYSFQVSNPHGMPTRKGFSKAMAAVEALQLIGGFSDPGLVLRINPTMAKFMSDEGGKELYQHGNYGERVGPFLGSAVRKLKDDPDTRQAVINVFSSHRDYVDEPDIPCTLSIQFMIRNGALDFHVTMRSNDVWWGLPYDMFQFTQLQLSVANVLNIPVGDYYHTSNSMHAYARNFDDIDVMLRANVEPAGFVPRGLSASNVPALQIRAGLIGKAHVLDSPTSAEQWYTEQVAYVSPRAE